MHSEQDTKGLVSCSGRFVSVKARSVYGKHRTAALSLRPSIRVATSAFIGMTVRNLLDDYEGRQGSKEKVFGLICFYKDIEIVFVPPILHGFDQISPQQRELFLNDVFNVHLRRDEFTWQSSSS